MQKKFQQNLIHINFNLELNNVPSFASQTHHPKKKSGFRGEGGEGLGAGTKIKFQILDQSTSLMPQPNCNSTVFQQNVLK